MFYLKSDRYALVTRLTPLSLFSSKRSLAVARDDAGIRKNLIIHAFKWLMLP
jgi:hypothetical protein